MESQNNRGEKATSRHLTAPNEISSAMKGLHLIFVQGGPVKTFPMETNP